MQTAPSFFVFFVVICLVTCEDSCDVYRVENGQVLIKKVVVNKNASRNQPRTTDFFFPTNKRSSVSNGTSLYIRCNEPYRFQGDPKRTFVEFSCTDGRWSPFPVCLLPRCNKRSLIYAGLYKGGERTFYHGESFVPRCLPGFKVAEAYDNRIICENGQWKGNLPPCTKEGEPCRADPLQLFGVVLPSSLTVAPGDWIEPKCIEGFEYLNRNATKLYCREGRLEGTWPPCIPKTCYRKNLLHREGVDLSNDAPVHPSMKAKIVCMEGYSLEYPEVRCIDGEWQTENNLSPCQKKKWVDECEVIQIPNGKILKERIVSEAYLWGTATRKKTVREEANIGSIESSGAVLYVECDSPYKFKGKETAAVQVSITCIRGEWTPLPECFLPRCLDQPPRLLNGRIKSVTTYHGSFVEYECYGPDQIDGKGNVTCYNGRWIGSTPTCRDKPGEKSCTESPDSGPCLAYIPKYYYDRETGTCKRFGYGGCRGNGNRYATEESCLGNCANSCDVYRVENGQVLIKEVVVNKNASGNQTTTTDYFFPAITNSSVSSGTSLYVKCNEPYRFQRDPKRTFVEFSCTDGRWNPFPVCLLPRCDKRSLLYPGLRKGGERTFYHGESFVPRCFPGFTVAEADDKRIICENGQWKGNLPPCTKGKPCATDILQLFGVVLSSSLPVAHGDWIEPKCVEGFEYLNRSATKLYCREGRWEGTWPPCFPKTCYRKNLSHKEGVDLSNDAPVHSFMKANISCMEGYSLEYPEVRCIHGEWQTENNLSPCQKKPCIIPSVANGELGKYEERYQRRQRNWMNVFQQVSAGATVNGNEELILKCRADYVAKFSHQLREITIICREGQLSPEPECVISHCYGLPPRLQNGRIKYVTYNHGSFVEYECYSPYQIDGEGNVTCYNGRWIGSAPTCRDNEKQLETEIPNVEVVTSVPVAILPDLQLSKSNDSLIENLNTNHSIIISDQQPHTVNNSVEDNLEDAFAMLDNSTEKKDTVVTNAAVNSSCSCTYVVEESVLRAHDGQKLVKYGDKILSGTIIAFYCNSPGYFRLRGVPSLQCPLDCVWHSRMFPSCVRPKENDIIIRVDAVPPENMKIGVGGALFVVPGTRLLLMCRANVRRTQHVDWSSPSSGGFKYSDQSRHVFKMMYDIHKVLPNNTGRYTCNTVPEGSQHTVDIQVDDVECPEIESAEGLVISYSPNRKFNGRATFYCSEPYMRNGPSHIICTGSGVWSEPPASCRSPTCSIGSLYNFIPEGVVPLVNADTDDIVPLGNQLQLGCDGEGSVLKGNNTAICSASGIWRTGNDIQCINGCSGLLKKNDSELQITPQKEFYSVGESITVSCPEGKRLTTDVERILCFSSGWTPENIPDCQ